MGFAAGELADDRVVGGGTDGDDGVGHAQAIGQTSGGADSDEAVGAQLDQLVVIDRRAGATHATCLHADRLALVGAGEAEGIAFLVHQSGTGVEEGFGDVLGPERVARHQNGGGEVGCVGSDVDRHGARVRHP